MCITHTHTHTHTHTYIYIWTKLWSALYILIGPQMISHLEFNFLYFIFIPYTSATCVSSIFSLRLAVQAVRRLTAWTALQSNQKEKMSNKRERKLLRWNSLSHSLSHHLSLSLSLYIYIYIYIYFCFFYLFLKPHYSNNFFLYLKRSSFK